MTPVGAVSARPTPVTTGYGPPEDETTQAPAAPTPAPGAQFPLKIYIKRLYFISFFYHH